MAIRHYFRVDGTGSSIPRTTMTSRTGRETIHSDISRFLHFGNYFRFCKATSGPKRVSGFETALLELQVTGSSILLTILSSWNGPKAIRTRYMPYPAFS